MPTLKRHKVTGEYWLVDDDGKKRRASPAEVEAGTAGFGKALVEGAGQGLTMGASDEIRAGIGAGLDTLFSGGSYAENYARLIPEYRAQVEANSAVNPKTALAGEIAGGLLMPALGAGWVKGAASGAGALMRGSAINAAQGANAGYWTAGEDDEAGSALKGGIVGAVAPWALAAGGAGGANALTAVGRSLFESVDGRAMRIIREKAAEAGVDPAEIIAALQRNPELTLADVDEALARVAQGTMTLQPRAMRTGGKILDERQASAPQRILGYLEEASGLTPFQQAPAVERRIDRAKRILGPEYDRLSTVNIPVTDELSTILETPGMKRAYADALGNWQTDNLLPGVDPVKFGVLPGDIVQQMKTVADKTVRSWTADPAAASAAKSVRGALLNEVDPMIPGYPRLRDLYMRTVASPREGLELGGGVFTGGDDRLRQVLMDRAHLTPEGTAAFRAGALRDAQEAVLTAPGAKGNQFWGSKLTGNDLARQRIETFAESPQARDRLLELIGDEGIMHERRSFLKPSIGSPTGSRLPAADEMAEAMTHTASIASQASAGSLGGLAKAVIGTLKGQSPAVAERITQLLLTKGMQPGDVQALLSGYVTPQAAEILPQIAPYITAVSGTATTGYLMDN